MIDEDSCLPSLTQKLGPYSEISEDIIRILNQDLRLNPNLIPHIPNLFTGTIINDKTYIFIITTEVYSRHASLDIHMEANTDSTPTSTDNYPGLSCQILSTLNGHHTLKKLKIGSRSVNLLVTCSTTLGAKQNVFVGSQTDVNSNLIRTQNARIFLPNEQMEAFVKAANDNLPQVFNLSNLRQLSSSYNHYSTYLPWRGTLADMDDTRYMPITTFTLCDTPDNNCYGCTYASFAKLASLQ